MSPGFVKPGSVAAAMLCARPTPDSSIPPHQRGTPAAWATSWIRSASPCPPTRPIFTLRTRHAPSEIAAAASAADRIDSSRQIGVSSRFASSAWSHEVLVVERLLDVVEPERVEREKGCRGLQRVGGVRVDGKREVGERLPHGRPPGRRRRPARSSA